MTSLPAATATATAFLGATAFVLGALVAFFLPVNCRLARCASSVSFASGDRTRQQDSNFDGMNKRTERRGGRKERRGRVKVKRRGRRVIGTKGNKPLALNFLVGWRLRGGLTIVEGGKRW